MTLYESLDQLLTVTDEYTELVENISEESNLVSIVDQERLIWKGQVDKCHEIMTMHQDIITTDEDQIRVKLELQTMIASKTKDLDLLLSNINGFNNNTLVSRYAQFLMRVKYLEQQITLGSSIFKTVESITVESLDKLSLQSIITWESTYPELISHFKNELATDKLPMEAAILAHFGSDYDISKLHRMATQWGEIIELHDRIIPTIQNQLNSSIQRIDTIDKFMTSQVEVKEWITAQITTLSSMVGNQAIQQFTTSLTNNIQTMEANLVILSELSESLLPDTNIEKMLCELTQQWVKLELLSYDKQVEIIQLNHKESGVESLCRDWVEFSIKLKEFMVTVNELLNIPNDDGSKSLIQPLQEQLSVLDAEYPLQHMLCAHISDFSLREQYVSSQLDNIKTVLQSPFTLLVQTFVSHRHYNQKKEYQDNLLKVTGWVDYKSQVGVWLKMLKGVQNIRNLLYFNSTTKDPNSM